MTENGGNIGVQKYEKDDEGSLIIIDSVKAYFGLGTKTDLNKFIQNQVESRKNRKEWRFFGHRCRLIPSL